MRVDHPCYGCINLRWDNVTLSHGETVDVPYCRSDYALTVIRCPEYESEEVTE